MKRKTKTIRVGEKLHGRIKKYAQSNGMKLEAWASNALVAALPNQPMHPEPK